MDSTPIAADPRRKHYRVDEPPLWAHLDLGERGVAACTIDNLSIEGIGLRVPSVRDHLVEVGTPVRLIFAGDDLPTPVWVQATVTYQRAGPHDIAYGLRFDDARALTRLLRPEVLTWFNRRREVRVAPAAGEPPIEVVLQQGDCTFEGALVDLSVSGAAIHTTEAPTPGPATLRLQLPGSQPLTLTGQVLELGPGDRVRIHLDDDPTGEWQHALHRYVERQLAS